MLKRFLLPFLAVTAVQSAEDSIPAGMNQFATAAYARIAHGADNIIFSPFNISTALSMVLAGARGRTAA